MTVLTTVKKNQTDTSIALPSINATVIELPFFGSGVIEAIKQLSVAKTEIVNQKSHILKRIINWLRRKYGILAAARIPEMIAAWYFPARKYIREHINQFDIVVSEYSPPTALILGRYAKRISKGRIKLVLDYRDSWTVSHYTHPGLPQLRWLEKLIEDNILKQADLIVAATRGIVLEFEERGFTNTELIENGYFDDISEAVEKDIPAGINLVYTGSYGGYRNLDFLDGALERLAMLDPELYQNINVFIVGQGETKCIHPKIKQLGKLDYKYSLFYQKAATVLFLVESGKKVAWHNLTGKFFEYLRYRKPIIAFGPKPSFEIARYLKEHAIGLVAEPVAENAAMALQHVLRNMHLYPGINLENYSRKAKSQQLLNHILGLFNR